MPTWVANWNGRCRERAARDGLLAFLEPVAVAAGGRRPWGSDPEAPAPPGGVRRFDGSIEGRVLIDWSAVRIPGADGDAGEAIRRGRASGLVPASIGQVGEPPVAKQIAERLSVETDDVDPRPIRIHVGSAGAPAGSGPSNVLFAPRGVSLHGVDFRNPYTPYRGEDRMSFVFLVCPNHPLLDGRLVRVFDRDALRGHPDVRFRTADWVLGQPTLTRRHQGGLLLLFLLSSVRYFFLSDLSYDIAEKPNGYPAFAAAMDELLDALGGNRARLLDAVAASVAGDFAESSSARESSGDKDELDVELEPVWTALHDCSLWEDWKQNKEAQTRARFGARRGTQDFDTFLRLPISESEFLTEADIERLATVGLHYIGQLVRATPSSLVAYDGLDDAFANRVERALANDGVPMSLHVGDWTPPSSPDRPPPGEVQGKS